MGFLLPRPLPLAAAVIACVAAVVLSAGGGAPASAAAGSWTGTYYNNLTLTGPPAQTQDDGAVLDFTWGGSPAAGVNADNWSARWERTDTYAAGTYRFTLTGDDGIRLFVDGVLTLNAWIDQPPTTYFTDVALSAGSHTARVELYDAGNAATVIVAIQDVTTIPPGWQGEYFANKTLSGSPARTRNDGENVAFEWNATTPGSPFPGVIPNDNFSVRWTRTVNFPEGVHQFTAVSDDGVRVYVDGQLILDYWIDQPPTEHSANKQMTAGPHTVVVEYYEAGGGASVSLAIDYRPDLGGFVSDTIISDLNVAIVFAFAPDGRVFLAEKDGSVRIFKNGALLPADYYTISPVNDYEDRGLIGMALDPNFAANGYVYLAYTYDNNPANINGPKTNQIIRVNASTPSGDVADPASKLVLLGSVVGTPAKPSCEDWPTTADCIPTDHLSHAVGNLKFGPDGMLYVTIGDGANYNTVDVRALRSQNIDRLAGKILRVNPANGQGLADNPFYNGDPTATRSKVWAYGFRNPFRFNFKPGTNVIFNGDVGWNTWEELNVVTAGGNFGWPCYEGSGQQDGYAAYATCQTLYTAGTSLPPLHEYEHPPDSASVGGAFTGTNSYPSQYQNTYFWGDYARGQVSTLKVDGSNQLVPGSVLPFSTSQAGPVQIEIGPEGDVYYLSLYFDENRQALVNELRRFRFVGDNRAPVAAAAGTPAAGLAPLNVQFSSAGSSDPDAGQAITYDWDFGDGSPHSSSPNPTHQYTSDGTYTATLTVTDPLFLTDTATVTIQVGNEPPDATIISPLAGSHYDVGDQLAFSGSATDPQQGALPASALSWNVFLVHCNEIQLVNCHEHQVTALNGVSGGSVTTDDHGDFTYYRITLTAIDSGNLIDIETLNVTPNRVDLTLDASEPGVQITLDGSSQTVPFTRSVPKNSQHTIFTASPQNGSGGLVFFTGWSDGGAQQHVITASANATYTASFAAATATPTPTPDEPPSLSIANLSNPIIGVAGLQVTPDMQIDDANGDPLYIAVAWGDGTHGEFTAITLPYVMPVFDHTYDWSGNFILTIAVSDIVHAPVIQTFTVDIGTPSDADNDGLPDDYEAAFPCLNASVADSSSDTDADSLTALEEYGRGSNSCMDDTDGDGYEDGVESAFGGAGAAAYCPIMRADVDVLNDGAITILDLSELASWFGQIAPPAPERYDQDGDGQIVILDLAVAGTFFGKTVDRCPL